MRQIVIPLKKSLRRLYEVKQECDDITVHIKVSTEHVPDLQTNDTYQQTPALLSALPFNVHLEPKTTDRETNSWGVRRASKISFEGGSCKDCCSDRRRGGKETEDEEKNRRNHSWYTHLFSGCHGHWKWDC